MSVRGIRGATVSAFNTRDSILEATEELLKKMIADNAIFIPDIASILFSVTGDLNATFPALAARKLGLDGTPLLCFTEIPVPDSLGLCIRILMHVNSEIPQEKMRHVYLKAAKTLRPDQEQ